MTTPTFETVKTTLHIKLQMRDLSIKRVTIAVRRPPRIIQWKDHYFYQICDTYYEEVSGEDLDNIKV
ncbi:MULTISPECIES: hypothetical protein [unclassified Microcoleus]|uniref:hypothetical protein n=1 Tax=unclassified Microcoleus TaxID=2642155 RepID=UPI001D559837|nr:MULTISPECIES: hypothetical protein [unclassified Microcoleus]MCC3464536.1 hypothetical protein [Microcoleus sp. PH2017_06_SFM_O_A]MCC3503036.1 hypothetical protein [Microcoleus sp. PH2017_19_SFW_U_A]TAE15488.1 MAG: hypothetical protein EAZ94_04320 [Oscillatoriales cyanobacterium]MCC3410559.1 hypothetical protein [Microcoleus sp. PH2017_02_FOX_O_A]MCC3473294.1 hypothetical protein [Microcoleus sp. PH2017_13_LAR_U_A]